MFDIITKEECWRWMDDLAAYYARPLQYTWRGIRYRPFAALPSLEHFLSRIAGLMKPVRPYGLKDIQDAFVLSRLGKIKGAAILEIGGGSSRVLPFLSLHNECWLIDKFEGRGRGPQRVPRVRNVRIVQAYMGDFSPELPESYFDFIFSISVVEHVPLASVDAFFKDCARVLKPGGRMIHAIDTYLFDSCDQAVAREFQERVRVYLLYGNRPDLGIRLVEAPSIDENVQFSCRYASVPDYVLHQWQVRNPGIKRVIGQVVSIKSEWVKIPPGAEVGE